MNNIRYLDPLTPRIRIIAAPEAGPNIPGWFLHELVDLVLPVEDYVQSYKSYEGCRGLLTRNNSPYEYRVKKKKVYEALLRKKAQNAAKFLRDNPIFLQEDFFRFNEKACEFLGSWEELKCKIESAQT